MFSDMPSGCPYVRCPPINTHFACHNNAALSGGISIKLTTNIQHTSANCC